MAYLLKPQLHCDEITEKYKYLWDKLNISYDRFVRTTSIEHTSLVHQFYSKVLKSDDVYMGRQSGWYCVFLMCICWLCIFIQAGGRPVWGPTA